MTLSAIKKGETEKMKKTKFKVLLWPLCALLVLAGLILVERTGVKYSIEEAALDFLPQEVLNTGKTEPETECLILYDKNSPYNYHDPIYYVLSNMRIGCRLIDVNEKISPNFDDYRTVVVAFSNLDIFKEHIFSLLDWVKQGGSVLFGAVLEPNVTLSVISKRLGFLYEANDYIVQNRIQMVSDLLPGGENNSYFWGDNNRYGLGAQLSDDCVVHMITADEAKTPMLWERRYGSGKIVVNNNDAFQEKESRGLISAAYSLLEDVFAYPVINASVIFIDDFPAPIPEGRNDIISEQYQMNMDVDTFYTNYWFPDMMRFSDRYGLKYTAMIVETYGDDTAPPFYPPAKIHRFKYFGGLILENGFELGIHGYNHMSLVLDSFDYKDFLDYTKWRSVEDMELSVREVIRFSRELFPKLQLKTYIPPSNVLSAKAREMLKNSFPQINTISGIYIDDIYGLYQEFGIGEDGVIDLPRIVSGYYLDETSRWTALSELGFHYINSYFIHPDDVFDFERSEGRTWDELRDGFGGYLQWLYESAKGIRNMSAQQAAAAVQRYSNISVIRTNKDGKYIIDIDGFYDEAWFLVRFGDCRPGLVDGGGIEHISEGLYLLKAFDDHVVITLEGGGR